MPQLWQCDVCGAQYRVGWLSHCYRCEGRPPKLRKAVEKPARRKRMPRIVAGVGPSNARAEQAEAPGFDVVGEGGTEFLSFAAPEPEEEPESVPAVVEDEPEPVELPATADPGPLVVDAAPELDVPVDGAQ